MSKIWDYKYCKSTQHTENYYTYIISSIIDKSAAVGSRCIPSKRDCFLGDEEPSSDDDDWKRDEDFITVLVYGRRMLANRDDGANPRHIVENDASNRSLILVIISRISGYDNQRVVKLGA